MKILAISDTHGNLPEIPKCDLLIIAGDVCPMYSHNTADQFQWLDTNFRNWLVEQNKVVDQIVGIAGNHDFVFEDRDVIDGLRLPWVYLQDKSFTYEGVKLYGLPWVPKLKKWAFYGDDARLHDRYEAIPDDTDIIVSHGPPLGIRDQCPPGHGDDGRAGSEAAHAALYRVKPRAFICGHIHEAFGKDIHRSGSPVYNVAWVDEFYDVRGMIVLID